MFSIKGRRWPSWNAIRWYLAQVPLQTRNHKQTKSSQPQKGLEDPNNLEAGSGNTMDLS